MGEALRESGASEPPHTPTVFERVAEDIAARGYALIDEALPPALCEALCARIDRLDGEDFAPAGIGRAQDHMRNDFVRRDEICWIDGADEAERAWLAWTGELRAYLNRSLFLGLFSFESHFAHYRPGDFYKRHVDALRGEANRVLTTVLYLNAGWQPADGGQMLLYPEDGGEPIARIEPHMGTLAVFLSEEFPHEVLPARRDRYSIAGWFRVNASRAGRVDPPR